MKKACLLIISLLMLGSCSILNLQEQTPNVKKEMKQFYNYNKTYEYRKHQKEILKLQNKPSKTYIRQ
jgi:hypothetical protein